MVQVIMLVSLYLSNLNIFLFSDEDILNSIHRFRPNFLAASNGIPTYYSPYEFGHTCLLQCRPLGVTNALSSSDEQLEQSLESRKCVAVPFVDSDHFQSNDVAKTLANTIKEVLFSVYHCASSLGVLIDIFLLFNR